MSDSVTYICFVQDHSGSMDGKKDLAITNFNEQRAKLLKEDDDEMDNLVTIVEFDDEIHCNYDNVPIDEIKEVTNWWTGGMTALYDAIAFGINNLKKKMDTDKRTDKAALIVIQTDGQENQSSDYEGEEGRKKINAMINELEDTKLWSFVFLGENIGEEVAMGMGFKMSNIMNYAGDKGSVQHAYHMSSEGLDTYMKGRKLGQTQTMNFFDNGSSNYEDKLKDKEPTNDNNS
jgi:hypothetical protein